VFLQLDDSLKSWRVWHELAWNDVQQRYRRSVIGPFWITLSLAIFVGTLGVLYSVLFKMDTREYIPFLATGFIVWNFINTLILESCQVFIESENIIKQIRVPLMVYVLRTIWRNVLILLHSLPVVVVVLLVFSAPIGAASLLIIPGLLLLCINGMWLGLLLGILCARYRDMPSIIQNLMQVVFFATPIFWPPELMKSHPYLVEGNIVYHMVELVRAPLLDRPPSPASWLSVIAFTMGGFALAAIIFRRHGRRVAHWL
jgi:ABC-type polysaccharide/polyol phosphate export permease